jgi:DNA-binding transcriptional LysR family regulator
MELRHLKYFLAVAEELNFRRAAEKLYITQPPLTRQIQELEQELGAELFDRIGKRIRLTKAGEFLELEARRLLDKADEIKRQVSSLHEGEQTRLRLGFVESALQSFLPGLISGIRNSFPEVNFELFEMPTERQIEALLHNRIDAGIIRFWGQVEELEYAKLLDESLVAICLKKLTGKRKPSSLNDLADIPFIAFSRANAPGLAGKIEEVLLLNDFSPRVVFDGGSLETIRQLILSGLGWAILPTYAIERIAEDERLISLAIANPGEQIEIGIAWQKGETNNTVRIFVDAAMSAFLR